LELNGSALLVTILDVVYVVKENDFALKMHLAGYWCKGYFGSYLPEELYRVRNEMSNDASNGSQPVSKVRSKRTGFAGYLFPVKWLHVVLNKKAFTVNNLKRNLIRKLNGLFYFIPYIDSQFKNMHTSFGYKSCVYYN
jgi:hypothetical protein